MQAKGLPNKPFDEIAANRVANNPCRHGQAEPRKIPGIGSGKYRKEGISRPACLLVDDVELALVFESLRRGQAAGSGLRLEGRNERGKRVRQ
jgi:hypothetical protein